MIDMHWKPVKRKLMPWPSKNSGIAFWVNVTDTNVVAVFYRKPNGKEPFVQCWKFTGPASIQPISLEITLDMLPENPEAFSFLTRIIRIFRRGVR